MGKNRISAIIALDGEKEFKAAVTGCNKELANLRSESKLAKEEFEGQSNTLEALRAKHEILEKTLEAHKKKIKATIEGLEHAKDSYEKIGNGIGELEKLYEKATEEMSRMEKGAGTSKEAIEKQRKEVERLSKELEKGRENYQKAGTRVQEWETRLNTARAGLVKTNKELATNEKYLDEAQRSINGCAKSIDAYGKKVKESVNATLSWKEAFKGAFAESVVSPAVDAIQEVGKEAVQLAQDLGGSANQIQAAIGATAAEMKNYKNVLMDLYENNYGDNLDDVADAVSRVTQNLGALNAIELQDVTEDAITLRDTFGFDYQEQLRTVKMLMDTFQVSSKEAYNLITQGAQRGLDKNGDLLDTINEYAVHYKQMGAGAEEFFNSLANGTAAGTFSVDKLGDAYKEFGIRVKDTANSTTEGFELLGMDADIMRTKFAAGGKSAKTATDEVITALFGMDDQVKQNQAGVALFGTMWEDLGKDGVQALMNLNGEINATNNTLNSIKDIKYDDIGNEISRIGRTIQVKFAEPLAKDILPKVAEGLEFVADNLETITPMITGLGTALLVYKAGKSKLFGSLISGVKNLREAMISTTTATEGATVVTKVFHAVCNMSPLAKVVALIVAATAAYTAYKAITSASTNEMAKERKEVKKLCKEMDNLTEAAKENKEQRTENIENTESEWLAYQNMSNTLYALAESEEESAGKKAKMKVMVDQLNVAMPELNLAIDEQTGALNQNKEAVDAVINSMKQKALTAAMEEQITEIMKEQARITLEVTKAEGKKAELDEKIAASQEKAAEATNEGTDALKNYGALASATNETTRELNGETIALIKERYKLEQSIEEGNAVIEESNKEMNSYIDTISSMSESLGIASDSTEEMGIVSEDTTATISEAYKTLKTSLEESLNNAANLFEEFNGGQEITTEEMLKNLESQKEGLKNWRDNMQLLASQAGKGMSEEFLLYLSEMGPQGANAVDALATALRDGNDDFEQICAEWEEILNIESETPGLVASYYEAGTNMAEGLKKGLEDKTPEVVTAATVMTHSAVQAVKTEAQIKSPSRVFRNEIGRMLALGMAAGIIDGTKEVDESAIEMCESAVDAAVRKLDIHSPSRVFRDRIGLNIATGLALGIKKGKDDVKKSSQEITTEIYQNAERQLKKIKSKTDVSLEIEKEYWKKIKKNLKEGTEEYEKASKKIQDLDFFIKTDQKGNFGISRTDADGAVKTAAKYSREVLDAATSWLSDYEKRQELTAEKEVKFWRNVRKELKEGTKAYKEATKNINEAQKNARQEKLTASDTALSQYKTYYNVSAKAEVQYWNIVRKQFKKGTDERIEADQKYYEAKENLNNQLIELNEEYVQNCADIQEQLKSDIQDLTDTYNEAVKERADSIYSSVGLFDEFKSESENGEKLLYNLKTQVAGIADWELQLQELTSRGLPTGLMEELQAMGPEASASLHALNSLTDEQLKEYTGLWEKKHALADSQAVLELEPLRKETENQIANLKTAAENELSSLKTTYTKAVNELNTGISTSLKTLAQTTKKVGADVTAALVNGIKDGAEKKDTKAKLKKAATSIKEGMGNLPKAGEEIGKNTLQGIVDGLINKKTMSTSAKKFVEQLKKEIQEAADIHSPSRLFKKEIGVQLSAGVAQGIEEEGRNVSDTGTDMIKRLLENTRQQLARQQDSLRNYMGTVNNGAGLLELRNLVSISPVQQVNATVDNSMLVAIMSEMMQVMQQGFGNLENVQIVTDTGALIGATSSGMSNEFARMSRRIR